MIDPRLTKTHSKSMHNIVNVIPTNSITLCQNNIIHNVIKMFMISKICNIINVFFKIVLLSENGHLCNFYDEIMVTFGHSILSNICKFYIHVS